MDDYIRILEELVEEVLQMQKEIKQLKTEKKSTLPKGWRIIPGTKDGQKKFSILKRG